MTSSSHALGEGGREWLHPILPKEASRSGHPLQEFNLSLQRAHGTLAVAARSQASGVLCGASGSPPTLENPGMQQPFLPKQLSMLDAGAILYKGEVPG